MRIFEKLCLNWNMMEPIRQNKKNREYNPYVPLTKSTAGWLSLYCSFYFYFYG